jgi:hypothetical protein
MFKRYMNNIHFPHMAATILLHSPLAEAFWAPQGGNYGKLICASMCHDSCKKPIAEKSAANDKAGKLDVTMYSYYTNSAKECRFHMRKK